MPYCISVIGLSPFVYWNSSLGQIFDYVLAFRKFQEEKEVAALSRTRWQTTVLLSVHLKKGKRIKPTDLLELPHEKANKSTTETKVLSKKEQFEMFGRDDRHMREKWEKQQAKEN